MPSPTETEFRVHASPVPTQTVFGLEGSMVTAPIDCTLCLSKMGLKVVPPFTDFQTPPLAAPMYTVRRPFSWTAARAATRPLIVAEPMLRAPSPEMVLKSTLAAGSDRCALIAQEREKEISAKPKTFLIIFDCAFLDCAITWSRPADLPAFGRIPAEP